MRVWLTGAQTARHTQHNCSFSYETNEVKNEQMGRVIHSCKIFNFVLKDKCLNKNGLSIMPYLQNFQTLDHNLCSVHSVDKETLEKNPKGYPLVQYKYFRLLCHNTNIVSNTKLTFETQVRFLKKKLLSRSFVWVFLC